ncbi:MAG: hypothetical protein ABI791_12370 [Acidobacteriota bacterium]
MELLIPGLILVALMAYASTRLKKATARALEAEDVETDEFSITKPAGFINVVTPDDGLLFQAYTKEFADTAPNARKAAATIRVTEYATIGQVVDELKQSAGFVSSRPENDAADSPVTVRIDRVEDGVTFHRSIKLIQKDDRVYRLQFDTPAECQDEFLIAGREINESFELKR